ncbi:MAG: CBS domain-containing protein [Actinomycetota bacterium]|nr:CBS domain-containing protein [Actinomycetota bacterium]
MEQQDIRELKVGDVMHEEWPTLGTEDTVESAIRLFSEAQISGAPVVEGDELVGIVTEGDLIFRDADIKSPGFLDILGGIVPLGDWAQYREEVLKSAGVTVGEVMTKDPVTVSSEDSLSEAATIMAEQRIKILPVVREGRLQGTLSRMDILTLHILNPRP